MLIICGRSCGQKKKMKMFLSCSPPQKIPLLSLLKMLVFLVYQGTKPTCVRHGCKSGTCLLQMWLVLGAVLAGCRIVAQVHFPEGLPRLCSRPRSLSHLQWLGVLCLCPPTAGASFLPSLPEPFEAFLGISAFRGIPGLQPLVMTLGGPL